MKKILKALQKVEYGDHIPAMKKLWLKEENKENTEDELDLRINKLRRQLLHIIKKTERSSDEISGRRKILLVTHQFVMKTLTAKAFKKEFRPDLKSHFNPEFAQIVPYEVRPSEFDKGDLVFAMYRLDCDRS